MLLAQGNGLRRIADHDPMFARDWASPHNEKATIHMHMKRLIYISTSGEVLSSCDRTAACYPGVFLRRVAFQCRAWSNDFGFGGRGEDLAQAISGCSVQRDCQGRDPSVAVGCGSKWVPMQNGTKD